LRSQKNSPRIRPYIKWIRVSNNEIRIYDPSTCIYNTIQDESSMIWELLDGKHSITQIATIISGRIISGEGAVDQILQEMNIFIATLEKLGLIDCSAT
jgi:hypothetical protein